MIKVDLGPGLAFCKEEEGFGRLPIALWIMPQKQVFGFSKNGRYTKCVHLQYGPRWIIAWVLETI